MSTSELRRMEEGGGAAEGEGGSDSGELKELYYPRRNGWNWPWHPLQVLAWVFIVFFTTTYFGFLVFYIPGAWRSIGYIVAGVLFVTHILSSLVTSIMDPAESSVRRRRARKTGGFLRAVFDRKKHKRVIENRYCNLCEVNVSESAKHCSVCDKCVKGFDHHCIWLNTCIGSRNYRWFLVTVFSALVACILLLVFTLSLFVTFFSDREHLLYACSDHFLVTNTSCNDRIRVFGAEVPDPVFPTLVSLIGLLAIVGVVMIGYLATFHSYLIIKGLTTYDYILLQRRLKTEKEKAEEEGCVADRDRHGRCWFLRRKVNRVNPTGGDATEKGQGSQESGLADAASESPSLSSVGLVNFGRTPLQSVLGSSAGDVSMDSTLLSSRWQPAASNQDCGDSKESQQNRQHDDVVIEMESQRVASITTAAVYQSEAARRGGEVAAIGQKLYESMDNGCDNDLESCGILAFMSSSDSLEPSPTSREKGEKEESDREDLENCGTLAYMSSANSIPSIAVPTGTSIAQDTSDGATTAAGCASTTAAGLSMYETATTPEGAVMDLLKTDSKEDEGAVRGGVTPSVSTKSSKLREKTYKKMVKSGKTVGLSALRELSHAARRQDSVTAMGGFSNPMSEKEHCSHVACKGITREQAYLPELVQETFPPLVKVALTAQPMVYDHQSLSSKTTSL